MSVDANPAEAQYRGKIYPTESARCPAETLKGKFSTLFHISPKHSSRLPLSQDLSEKSPPPSLLLPDVVGETPHQRSTAETPPFPSSPGLGRSSSSAELLLVSSFSLYLMIYLDYCLGTSKF